MSEPLVAFLRSCLDDDARMALAAKNALDEWQAGNAPAQRWSVDHDAPLGVYVSGEWCCVGEGVAAHIGAQSPERMLAEAESKRQILDSYIPPGADPHPGEPCTNNIEIDPDGLAFDKYDSCERHLRAAKHQLRSDHVLRLLAIPYVDRSGYDPAWGEA